MAGVLSRLRSISMRINAIALAGALGIAGIAGAAAYLGTVSANALKVQGRAAGFQGRVIGLSRYYFAARQDFADLLRTQQTVPAEAFAEHMKAISTETAALAERAEAHGVGEPLAKLGDLARRSEEGIRKLAKDMVETGIDLDSGLLGASTKAGEELERLAVQTAMNDNSAAAWRIAQAASIIRQLERTFVARRDEHRLGEMEV
ncbi:MAG TPA: hypothetical protein VHK66_01330, partial [Microvirga sp.]|nr:hypothetical protein [Microvirga sp.]